MMMKIIHSGSKRKNLFFTQLSIKMVLLFLLTIYAVTGSEDQKNEDLNKAMKLESKKNQWIKERRSILLQMDYLDEMLGFDSTQITNANILKITNRAVFSVILPFLKLEDFLVMYTINKNFYQFIRRNYSIGGDKKRNLLTFHPLLSALNAPHDQDMETTIIKTTEKEFLDTSSAVLEYLPDPYKVIEVFKGQDLSCLVNTLWCNILYENDAQRLHISFPNTNWNPHLVWNPIEVHNVLIPGVVVRNGKDSPTKVYRFTRFDLLLTDRSKDKAKELYLDQDIRVEVIYQNVDTPGQFVTWILTLKYAADPWGNPYLKVYCDGGMEAPDEECKWILRLLMFPSWAEMKYKHGPAQYIKNSFK